MPDVWSRTIPFVRKIGKEEWSGQALVVFDLLRTHQGDRAKANRGKPVGKIQCLGSLCFEPLRDATKFFGFSEFLAALALMVLCWTIGDFRYRFRVRIAPLPLQSLTYWSVGFIGLMTLLTDLWRTEHWPVPRGHLITPGVWQSLLGLLFLTIFLTWAWFAFNAPARFGPMNAKRFGRALYQVILRGSPAELPEAADEVARSARSLISLAWENYEMERSKEKTPSGRVRRFELTRSVAHEMLLLIADRRFCAAVVAVSPITALELFSEMAQQRRFGVDLGIFARNITSAAIANRDSFAYQEVSGYHTGLLGMHRPLTSALYGNYPLVESLRHVFDVDYKERDGWDSDQWRAYFRLAVITLKDYVHRRRVDIPRSVWHVMNTQSRAHYALRSLNGNDNAWATDVFQKFDAAVDFAREIVEELDKGQANWPFPLRSREKRNFHDFYEDVAEMIFDLICSASYVTDTQDLCWMVQHNVVWTKFFDSARGNGRAGKVIMFKVRRMIYDEIVGLKGYPNYVGATLLGLLFNVLGFNQQRYSHTAQTRPLKRAVLAWTKRNYAEFFRDNPRLGAATLVAGITYDSDTGTLTKVGMQILDREPHRSVFVVDEPEPA